MNELSKLKILIVAETYLPEINGAALFGNRLAEGLSHHGHTVFVIAPCSKRGKSFVMKSNGITEYRLKSHPVFMHPTFRVCLPFQVRQTIQNIFDEIKPDVVHVQSHFSLGRVCIVEAKKRHIPVIATMHIVDENLIPYLWLPSSLKRKFISFLWKDAHNILVNVDKLIAPTQLAAEKIRNSIQINNIVAISNGIKVTHYEKKPHEEITKKSSPIILFVGRLSPEKNLPVLIEAIAKIPAKYNVILELIGEGNILKDLQKLAVKLHVDTRIHFRGYVDNETLRHAYLQASLFCMPGIAELQSLSTLEAMSAALPVVLADALALPHLIVENKNGFLFKPDDSTDLASKIITILDMPREEQIKMGIEGQNIAHNQHNLDKALTEYEMIYHDLIRNRQTV